MDLLIKNAGLLTPQSATSRNVDILIRDQVIESVLPPNTIQPGNVPELEADRFYAMSGLVNAHTHSHNAISRGIGDSWTLELLLNYGPALNANRTPEDHYWSAMLNGLENLKNGTTTVYDLVIHSPFPTRESLEAVVQAYRDLGLRAVVAPAIADKPVYEIIPGLIDSLPEELAREAGKLLPEPGSLILSNVERALQEIKSDDLVRLAIAPTIPAQCSDEFLNGCLRLAKKYDTGLHTHLAESKIQAHDGLIRYGKTLTEHLYSIGILDSRFVAAHGVWLSSNDVSIAADVGMHVVHNPASNLKLGSGIAPVRELLESGVNIALGTDGSASSDNQNMIEAMRIAGLSSRIRSARPDQWLNAKTTMNMASVSGGLVCELGDHSGEIRPGAPADIVLLRRDSVYLNPVHDLRTQLVFAETGAAVDTVIVNGEIVLQNGLSSRVEEKSILVNAGASAKRFRSLNQAEFEFARRMTPYIEATCSDLAVQPYLVDRLMLASA